MDGETAAGRAVKTAQAALDAQVLARYRTLTEDEIRTLVIDDKWLATIGSAVDDEVRHVARQLVDRVVELKERYVQPLHALEHDVQEFTAKVGGHMERMGLLP